MDQQPGAGGAGGGGGAAAGGAAGAGAGGAGGGAAAAGAAGAGATENNNNKKTKLRLMCSYGGQIVPRPHDKSLTYVGGETRLILSDRQVSLLDLTTRLSKTLLNNLPFFFKYQLPSEDLDSLISITTQQDLEYMIDEYDRLNGPRIRLFLFTPDHSSPSSFVFSRSSGGKSEEEWFLNALNNGSTLIPDSASVNSLLGLVGNNNDDQRKKVQEATSSVPDSPIMDTSSSFGSTSSSSPALAMANLPPIRVREAAPPPQQQTVVASAAETSAVVGVPLDMASPDSLSSDTSLTNPLSRQSNMMFQEPSVQIQNQNPPSTRVPTPVDPKLSDSSPTYVFPAQFEQHFQQLNPQHHHQQQQQAHYIQSGSQYVPSPYYIVYPPQQQYPSTYISARPPQQTYNIQSSYAPPSMGSSQNPQQFMGSSQNPQQFMGSSQNPQQFMGSSQNPQKFMGSSQNPQQFMGYPPIHNQSHQSIAPSSDAATGNFAYEYTDQTNPRVVYTQQMAPQMAVQYQNIPPVLSEASAQVPTESFKHQNRAPQS